MSTPATPRWRDPLFSPGDRFPLGPPPGFWDGADDEPSGTATRPFSMRHLVPGTRMDVPSPRRYSYCHERQVALVHAEDGTVIEMAKHTTPGATPKATTEMDRDGDPKNPPPEEMTGPDYQSD